jgi:tRNA (cytidine/uridine-2'-O-)-methyltransferase
MFHIVLFEPEIPPNTGNIIRLCANSGSTLHLIHPLGFGLDDRNLRRAGLDYAELAGVQEYADLAAFLRQQQPERLFACTTRGRCSYAEVRYRPGDALLFGPETRGLPGEVLGGIAPGERIKIPMVPGNRSLNLSNAVAVVLYEAWRQQGFRGAQDRGKPEG